MKLIDRQVECGMLDRLVEAVRAGESRAIVVSGDPGVGKTALLEHLSGKASGCRLAPHRSPDWTGRRIPRDTSADLSSVHGM